MTELEMVTGGAETPFGIGMPTQTRSPILDGALLNPWDLPAGNPTQDALAIFLKVFLKK